MCLSALLAPCVQSKCANFNMNATPCGEMKTQHAGEEEQPELPQKAAQAEAGAAIQPDPAIVEALVQMGFTENGSKRAAVATQVSALWLPHLTLYHCPRPLSHCCQKESQDAFHKGCNVLRKNLLLQNNGPEASMEWILSHMDDADLNDPIPEPSVASAIDAYSAKPESVMMLSSMGFTDRQVIPHEMASYAALLLCLSGNVFDGMLMYRATLQAKIEAFDENPKLISAA